MNKGFSWGGGINREKFIPAKIFELNDFDIDRYISIKNKNISIVSDDCFGGFLYNSLGLKFNTPFINCFVNHNSWFKLISNLEYYLSLPLDLKDNDYEIIKGYLDNDIEIGFNHDISKQDILSKWNRRLKRFNFNNYILKMNIYSDEEAYQFENLNIKNKLGFYYKDIKLKSILGLEEWKNIHTRYKCKFDFFSLVRKSAMVDEYFGRYYDAFKLLNGEADFKRNIIYK